MEALEFTPATIILLAIICGCVVLAVRRLMKRGMCDCGDHCEEGGCHGCSGCASAPAQGQPKSCPVMEEKLSKLP